MTKKECAVVMAYTGVCMLKGDDLKIFYDYVSELLGGKPIWTHELPALAAGIKEASWNDFLNLCSTATEDSEEAT